ncbi:hypothetical protein M378DRAFT_806932 [Amanita muscaria Koide BX008]|uniref:Uncharacterized protein n=1 Tax=Amanita muscaria (strain Koide BX008) TaxID=946122 RepID=A0A0C2T641_AMAMK|nr:hypothetical protein M378DRAFT_806932 [Amanita muscaria Koide BX008]
MRSRHSFPESYSTLKFGAYLAFYPDLTRTLAAGLFSSSCAVTDEVRSEDSCTAHPKLGRIVVVTHKAVCKRRRSPLTTS